MSQLDTRLAALRRFAFAITVLNILGHTVLGFEPSWAYPLVALPTAYLVELSLEVIGAWSSGRQPRFLGRGVIGLIEFLLPAHISGLACSMLLYANEHVEVVVFAVCVALGSKVIFRPMVDGAPRHVLNPSNTGIAITLLAFPWVGIAPPYQFTEGLTGAGDWMLPLLIVVSGSYLNAKLTRRIPLITAWLVTFAALAIARALVFSTPVLAGLVPMTGMAFVLFTFYMASDPPTTPRSVRNQIIFGAALALTYSALQVLHVAFGLFFALFLVCLGRGVLLLLFALGRERVAQHELAVAERVRAEG